MFCDRDDESAAAPSAENWLSTERETEDAEIRDVEQRRSKLCLRSRASYLRSGRPRWSFMSPEARLRAGDTRCREANNRTTPRTEQARTHATPSNLTGCGPPPVIDLSRRRRSRRRRESAVDPRRTRADVIRITASTITWTGPLVTSCPDSCSNVCPPPPPVQRRGDLKKLSGTP